MARLVTERAEAGNPQPMAKPDELLDVLIVGAGISGISMAAHMKRLCPGRSFALVEQRAELGGTWDLFRYPGVRSDSDMHSLGFRFAPWTDDRAIASGEAILDYLRRVVDEHAINPHIRFDERVQAADWRSAEACWHVAVAGPSGPRELRARFLYLATGYYDYDEPHDARLPALERFSGPVLHPQFWPAGVELAGKRVVVIGSGATAVTLVPALAKEGADVTMLQRTPTWMVAQPSVDAWARRIRRWLPQALAYRLIRFLNVRLHHLFFTRSRARPDKVAAYLRERLKAALGRHYDVAQFEPPYPPWDQRLCLVPDGDLFEAVRSGEARVVTGRIAGFEEDAILLESGERVPADVVVTATGLKLVLAGKAAVSLDGQPVDWTQRWFYRGCMFSNVPNLAVVFGYLNTSWTLRADNNADYACRVLNRMEQLGAAIATPVLPANPAMAEDDIIVFSSGYLQRARALMPKSAAALPWRLNQDYFEDCRDFRTRPIEDGVLRFERGMAAASEAA
jgi:cation diffusion facilitator CzcD-associated flavoprotein CzcO